MRRCDPVEDAVAGNSRGECDRHPVNPSTRTRFGSIDVGMRIYPENGELGAPESLANCPCDARDRPDSDRVVSAECCYEVALSGVRIDAVADLLRCQADCTWPFHVVGVWVCIVCVVPVDELAEVLDRELVISLELNI